MVSSSKILTVSYGTFSCTLEGFDDSFDTMKAIAEYFRDLAQDDRYFGAEPPTPDADMLARIAEREIARRVEARLGHDGGVVLRTGPAEPAEAETTEAREAPAPAADAQPDDTQAAPEEDALAAAVDARVADEAASDAAADLSDAPIAEAPALPEVDAESGASDMDDAADTDIAVEEDTPQPLAPRREPDAEVEAPRPSATEVAPSPFSATPEQSVAAKLARIRAVVASNAAPAAATAAAAPVAQAFSEDEHAEEMMGGRVPFVEDSPEAAPAEDEMQADAEAESTADEEDIAEEEDTFDPARLAAALSEEASSADEPAETEDLEDLDEHDSRLGDTIAGLVSGQADGTDLDEESETFAEAPVETDDIAETPAAPPSAEADTESEDQDDAPEEDDAPTRSLRIMKVKRADFERALSEGEFEAVEDDDDENEGIAPSAAARTSDSTLSEDDEADLLRELAALEAEEGDEADEDDEDDLAFQDAPELDDETEDELSDLDDFEEDDDLDTLFDEDDDEAPEAEAQPKSETGTPFQLTSAHAAKAPAQGEDDEDDLAAELDAAFSDDPATDLDLTARAMDDEPRDEALDELNEEDAERFARASEGARRAVKMASPARAMLTEGKVEDTGTGVDRLLDETNREMEEPDSKGRRTAIQHLRAAVAATRADKLLGRGRDETTESEPYREDLKNVVRPRRPEPVRVTERPSARPAPSRPAPLKLVAEQRVDETGAASRPIRPRRVAQNAASTQSDNVETDMSFAEYAESVGAYQLGDLLEAAAAYLAFVENRRDFSRPQLMTKVREAEEAESSREDRLRSFGQLLREGKIAKLEGGRFAASQQIGFKPDARAAS
ncbi:hypothetical protein SAMN05421853_104194 [Roseivivax halotolerans]|uniref:Lipoprotein n=1 Tax=Roseivivax halotolerans TaxID=93684 RepID=A0A1I5XXD3_9RHOB|nr:hypothetical protein [Roseivivax halotolerans]SFQ36530.1 hypothetical protein SAMN05421853_104194 [Roseivivax halotolerans]